MVLKRHLHFSNILKDGLLRKYLVITLQKLKILHRKVCHQPVLTTTVICTTLNKPYHYCASVPTPNIIIRICNAKEYPRLPDQATCSTFYKLRHFYELAGYTIVIKPWSSMSLSLHASPLCCWWHTLPIHNDAKNLKNDQNSTESTQRELSNEYQHERV